MSQQNVETIRGIYEAFGRGDIPEVLAAMAPDIEWVTPESIPWGGTFHGQEEVGGFFQGIGEKLDELHVEPEQYLDAGDHVVVLGTHRARAKGGGDFEARWVMVWEMRDGKATRFQEIIDSVPVAQAFERQPA
jgi:uncharacterized protein